MNSLVVLALVALIVLASNTAAGYVAWTLVDDFTGDDGKLLGAIMDGPHNVATRLIVINLWPMGVFWAIREWMRRHG